MQSHAQDAVALRRRVGQRPGGGGRVLFFGFAPCGTFQVCVCVCFQKTQSRDRSERASTKCWLCLLVHETPLASGGGVTMACWLLLPPPQPPPPPPLSLLLIFLPSNPSSPPSTFTPPPTPCPTPHPPPPPPQIKAQCTHQRSQPSLYVHTIRTLAPQMQRHPASRSFRSKCNCLP